MTVPNNPKSQSGAFTPWDLPVYAADIDTEKKSNRFKSNKNGNNALDSTFVIAIRSHTINIQNNYTFDKNNTRTFVTLNGSTLQHLQNIT